jgi:hypothetical protein
MWFALPLWFGTSYCRGCGENGSVTSKGAAMDLTISYHHGLDLVRAWFSSGIILVQLGVVIWLVKEVRKNRDVLANHLRQITRTQPMYQCENFRRITPTGIDREAA